MDKGSGRITFETGMSHRNPTWSGINGFAFRGETLVSHSRYPVASTYLDNQEEELQILVERGQ